MITAHDETDPAEPVEPEGWQGVTDDALATWAIDKLAHYTRERDRIRRNAQAYIEQIQADAAADEKPLADKIQSKGFVVGSVVAPVWFDGSAMGDETKRQNWVTSVVLPISSTLIRKDPMLPTGSQLVQLRHFLLLVL